MFDALRIRSTNVFVVKIGARIIEVVAISICEVLICLKLRVSDSLPSFLW